MQHLWFGRRAATRIRSELMAALKRKELCALTKAGPSTVRCARRTDTTLCSGAICHREPRVWTRSAVQRSRQRVRWQRSGSQMRAGGQVPTGNTNSFCMYHLLASFNTREQLERTCTNGKLDGVDASASVYGRDTSQRRRKRRSPQFTCLAYQGPRLLAVDSSERARCVRPSAGHAVANWRDRMVDADGSSYEER